MSLLSRLFKPSPPAPARKPTLHDYRDQNLGWGHDIHYRPMAGNRLDAGGWGHGIRVGDYIALTNRATGGQPWYIVESIEYMRDPRDQWFGVIRWVESKPLWLVNEWNVRHGLPPVEPFTNGGGERQ